LPTRSSSPSGSTLLSTNGRRHGASGASPRTSADRIPPTTASCAPRAPTARSMRSRCASPSSPRYWSHPSIGSSQKQRRT
jgi:hypothetical protein